MANIGKEILERQNQTENLVLLLAQREIYSSAKKLQFISIIIVALIPLLISIIGYFNKEFSNQYPNVAPIYGIFATVLELFIGNLRDSKKDLASSIQESFDTRVFKIDKNKNLGTFDIDDSVLFEYKSKIDSGYNIDNLKDWYSDEIIELKTNIAVIFCQRTNVSYDYDLRKKYIKFLFVFTTFILSILLFFGLSNDISLKNFFTQIVVPMLPIFIFSYNEVKNQYKAINNLKELQVIISKNLDEITLNSTIDMFEIRQIQDRIYENRKTSPLVFDFIYNILRDKKNTSLEQTMHFSISKKIQEMKEQENTNSNGA